MLEPGFEWKETKTKNETLSRDTIKIVKFL